MDQHKPRVSGATLRNYLAQPVILACELVNGDDPHQLRVRSCDGVEISVAFADSPQENVTRYLEVTGIPLEDGTMAGWVTTNLGDDFDLQQYGEAIELVARYPQPFVRPNDAAEQ
eukprot:m.87270 g.87270  ORF g.87270 m.87270 type:complete len:115 (-) comp18010_c0_seq1:30-374(-)